MREEGERRRDANAREGPGEKCSWVGNVFRGGERELY